VDAQLRRGVADGRQDRDGGQLALVPAQVGVGEGAAESALDQRVEHQR